VHKDKKCPGCQKTWTGKVPVGEAAAGKLKQRGGQKRAPVSTPVAVTSAASRRKVAQEDEEMEEEQEEDSEQEEEEEAGADE
jgi:hypothetical protein